MAALVLVGGCAADQAADPAQGPKPDATAGVVGCLQDRGWEVTGNPDGSYSAAIPDDQLDQFEADEADCVSVLGFDQPVTEAQAEAYFDALLEVADCIRQLGYEVEEPPSRRAAIEEIQKPIIDLGWNPYDGPMFSASREDLDRVYRDCPRPPLY